MITGGLTVLLVRAHGAFRGRESVRDEGQVPRSQRKVERCLVAQPAIWGVLLQATSSSEGLVAILFTELATKLPPPSTYTVQLT